MSTRKVPTLAVARETLRRALYDPDPFERASAGADLALWGLPTAPSALLTAADNLVVERLRAGRR